MKLVCLDLEGVLVPEIWIRFAEETGVEKLRLTTRDIPDYDQLMRHRIEILAENGFRLSDIQDVIARIDPYPGAKAFLDRLREHTQVVLLSDTFQEFAGPLMQKLDRPTLLCNELVVDQDDAIVDFRLRQKNGKEQAVRGFQNMGLEVTAVGDSYNDLSMLRQAQRGALFCPPDTIRREHSDMPAFESYEALLSFLLHEHELSEERAQI
jgi:phosphoserine/homoserine phosphotransferase